MNKKYIVIGVAAVVVILIGVFIAGLVGGNQPAEQTETPNPIGSVGSRFPNGIAVGFGASITTAGEFVTTQLSRFTGTTTVSHSYDGFMVGDEFSVGTETPQTIYTHTAGPALCNASFSGAFVDSTGDNAALQFAVGTTTAAGLSSTNLIATSTVATNTDAYLLPTGSFFFQLNTNDVITATWGDGDSSAGDTNASSTTWTNLDSEYQIGCWLIED